MYFSVSTQTVLAKSENSYALQKHNNGKKQKSGNSIISFYKQNKTWISHDWPKQINLAM
jgi:hypothetical protein